MKEAEALQDAGGHTVGWTRPWGRGRLIAYGIFPDAYTTTPHPSVNMTGWVRQLIQLGDLKFTGRWASETRDSGEGHLGTGAPVVEVVIRVKSPDEKFVFCLNQGGPGEGVVEVPVGGGSWRAEDLVTGQEITAARVSRRERTPRRSEGIWRLPLHLEAWGYRVIRLWRP
jgi:hypothetical protein